MLIAIASMFIALVSTGVLTNVAQGTVMGSKDAQTDKALTQLEAEINVTCNENKGQKSLSTLDLGNKVVRLEDKDIEIKERESDQDFQEAGEVACHIKETTKLNKKEYSLAAPVLGYDKEAGKYFIGFRQ
jgi:hypothetical protein